MEDNWISLDDQKPEPMAEVLVWKEFCCDVPIQAYYSEKSGKWHGSREVRDCMDDGYVRKSDLTFIPTHWQPLPAPPQTVKQKA